MLGKDMLICASLNSIGVDVQTVVDIVRSGGCSRDGVRDVGCGGDISHCGGSFGNCIFEIHGDRDPLNHLIS